MLKKILNFIYSKKDEGPYRKRTIFGIKIITKPSKLLIEYFNKRLDHLYSYIWDRHVENNERLDHLYSYIWDRHVEVNNRLNYINSLFNKLQMEILVSRSLPKIIIDETMPLVSVIITVYDIGEKYLRHCLETVINQSYKNIEIIIVNDYSNFEEDESICLEYKSKDKRIKYIKHKENMGDGIARMTGLKAANGYAIHFVDGDDYLDLNLYKICMSEMVKNNIDIICFNHYIIGTIGEYDDNMKFMHTFQIDLIPYTTFVGNEVLDIYCKKSEIIRGYLWNKLFKRELLFKLGFDNIPARYKCKDMNYGFKIFSIANSCIYLPIPLYFYIGNRVNSFVNAGRNKDTWFTDIYNIFLDLYNFVDKKDNEKITELFSTNFQWIYNEALKYFDKYSEKYYLNLLKDLTIDLIRLGVINKEKFIKKIMDMTNDENLINWLEYTIRSIK